MLNQLQTTVILASGSPRRNELLRQVGIEHQQILPKIDETRFANETPVQYIERMVAEKTEKSLQLLNQPLMAMSDNAFLVITADTIGVLPSGEVLQKPTDFDNACEMWRQMSGKNHQVWTAIQVSKMVGTQQNLTIVWQQQTTVKTEVEFIPLTEQMMTNYWQTGEPHDKAGGYAIQGMGASWVKGIQGSYSNVVGLPLVETIELLQQADKF